MGRYDQTDGKKSNGLVIGAIGVLLLAGGWLYLDRTEQRAAEPEIKQIELPLASDIVQADQQTADQLAIEQAPTDPPDFAIQASPAVAQPLPELADSDEMMRQAMLGACPQLAPWLATDQLIKKYLIIANDFSQGLWLEKHRQFLQPPAAFSVQQTDNGSVIAEASYRRYDSLAQAIDGIDARAAIMAYQKFKPLLSQVFDQFGYPPERPMDDLFLKAAAQILAAPIIEQPIPVVRPSVFYKFADAELEKLNPVAKLMLRMGPENTRLIQRKTKQLAQELSNARE